MQKIRNLRRISHILHKSGEKCSKCLCPILLVEDQRSIAMMLAALIEDRFGLSTVIAGTLAEAEQLIATQLIHLAIADLNLPDAPHGEIIDLLAMHRISTIALTGTFGQEMRETVLNKGVIDYIPKQTPHAIEYAVEIANRIYQNHHTNVLVVDDSLSSRAMLKHLLEKQQLNVVSASDATEALAILHQQPNIRLALIDYEMPGINGFELIHEIRKKSSKEELAIIGISATDNGEISAQFLKSGANDFIRKPFSYEEILCRIGQNLEVLDLIQQNRNAAYRDFLTGLPNRRHFFSEGERLHKQAARQGNVAAAMLDVDHFKKINDTYGHDCGDEVLIHLASLLSEHFTDHLAARLGGEEFAVILKDTSRSRALDMLEAFRRDIENNPAQCATEQIPFTISIGLTDQPGNSIDEFLKSADRHLYQAKKAGRNRVVSND